MQAVPVTNQCETAAVGVLVCTLAAGVTIGVVPPLVAPTLKGSPNNTLKDGGTSARHHETTTAGFTGAGGTIGVVPPLVTPSLRIHRRMAVPVSRQREPTAAV